MPVPNFLKNIIGGKAGEIVTSIGDTLDKFIQTKGEKDAAMLEVQKQVDGHLESMANVAQQELEAHLKDVQDARDANVKVQESEKASWMAKNVAYMIDILLAVVWSASTFYILAKALKLVSDNADMTIVLSIYSTLTAVFMTVLNFHRGTSAGSKASGDVIRNMVKNKS